jgi:hypothetical protein
VGTSVPAYPAHHAGPVIVAGSAWSLHDDLARAWKIYPGTPVIAVNGAAREVKALAIVTQHPQNLTAPGCEWIRHQRRLFGDGFAVHSNAPGDGVDYVWDLPNRGGSAWLARRIAGLIGFSQVILCGCPMEPGAYTIGHNLGGYMHRQDVVDELFRQIERDREWHAGAVSMSGRTGELLPC